MIPYAQLCAALAGAAPASYAPEVSPAQASFAPAALPPQPGNYESEDHTVTNVGLPNAPARHEDDAAMEIGEDEIADEV